MQKRWSRSAFSPTEEIVWWLGQITFGLLLIVALYAFIANSISGGTLAQRVYANDIALLATIAAHSPDNFIVSEQINKFKDTEFSVTLRQDRVDVLAQSLRSAGSMWLFSQEGVTIAPATIAKATGMVRIMREGDNVTLLRQEEGRSWRFEMLACPRVETKDAAAFTRRHLVVAGKEAQIASFADVLQARLGGNAVRAVVAAEADGASVDGISIALSASAADRIVVFVPVGSVASAKLGCLIVNNALLDDAINKRLAGAVVVPSAQYFAGQGAAVVVVLPERLLTEPALGNALMKGVQEYYG